MKTVRDLFSYLHASPTAAHAGEETARRLREAGYTPLSEGEVWHLEKGGKYYVSRGLSALIAFRLPARPTGFLVVASHSDSPTFHVNPDPENTAAGKYTRLSVEKYGGMLSATWMDRPLSVAGTVCLKTDSGVTVRTVKVERDLLIIPSVAIHMNRNANDGATYNPAVDMQPLFGDCDVTPGTLRAIVAEEIGVEAGEILEMDLGLYNRATATVLGAKGEYISGPRLDDLMCAYTALEGFLTSSDTSAVPVYALFDNEEVGSSTACGADSTFLTDVFARIAASYHLTVEEEQVLWRNSFLVSADNAHAKHPNHPEYSDPLHAPVMGGGVVIKQNANRRYMTDGTSAAVFGEICRRAGVPTQTYCNRADIPGGSTLGCIATSHFSVPGVDIGLAQLAMHSSYETAGKADVAHMINALRAFYGTVLTFNGADVTIE